MHYLTLNTGGGYVRMLFIDFSSAFNTIIPGRLVTKLTNLGLPLSICQWIIDFLTNRPQTIRIGPHISQLTLSTGSPQGCVLSPLLYSLYTHDCTSIHSTNTIIKYADDTMVVGVISGVDESSYREEVCRLVEWCKDNNLILNRSKTKELIIDFRRKRADTEQLHINGECVERVPVFNFLGTHIAEDISWTTNTHHMVKKAQQRLHFLRILRKNHLEEKLLVSFYRCSIERVLAYCISTLYASCSAADRRELQRVINTAQKIIGCALCSLQDIFSSRCLTRSANILRDPSHHSFALLPSGNASCPSNTEQIDSKTVFTPLQCGH